MKQAKRLLAFLLATVMLLSATMFVNAANEKTPHQITLLEKVKGKLKANESIEYVFSVPEDNTSVNINFIGFESSDRTYGTYKLSIFDQAGEEMFSNGGRISFDDTTLNAKLSSGKYTMRITENGNYTFEYAIYITASVFNDIPVTKITLDKTKTVMSVGDAATLKVTYEPFYTTFKTVWSTSNKKIVAVDKNGKIVAKTLGVAKITASVGAKKATCTVTVNKDNKAVTVYQNESKSIVSRFKQVSNYEKAKWSSSNTKIVKVDKEGKVTGLRKGSAIITAKIGKKTFSCSVTVPQVKINTTLVYLHVGESFKLKVSGTSKVSSWSSSKPTVVSVDKKGNIKAKKTGVATITAVVNKKKYSCKVTVEELAYGTIAGSVSYYFNSNYGYVADTGAKIYVLDEYRGEIVASGMADGTGSYSLQVPTGTYVVMILSAHNESLDTLYDDKQRKEIRDEYGIYLVSEMMSWKNVTVSKNQILNVSQRFGMSDF